MLQKRLLKLVSSCIKDSRKKVLCLNARLWSFQGPHERSEGEGFRLRSSPAEFARAREFENKAFIVCPRKPETMLIDLGFTTLSFVTFEAQGD